MTDGWISATKKLILAVIDGLGPELLDRAIAGGHAPEPRSGLPSSAGADDACVSTFPSLTPVCLSALVTGRHPAGSGIPSMTWYHRGEQRLVEYGSSFLATLAEGTRQMVDDVLVNLNLLHLSPPARQPCSRRSTTPGWSPPRSTATSAAAAPATPSPGRRRRRIARRVGIVDAVYGPRRYFFGELFASDQTGRAAQLRRPVDRHGGRVGRWLVTRDGFDFLFLYLYETDAAQHRAGDVMGAVAPGRRGLGCWPRPPAAGTRCSSATPLVVVADHSQSAVTSGADAAERSPACACSAPAAATTRPSATSP